MRSQQPAARLVVVTALHLSAVAALAADLQVVSTSPARHTFDRDGWVDLVTVNEVSADLRVFKAKGLNVAMPDLGALTGPLTVQLQRSGGGPCFGATFSAPF